MSKDYKNYYYYNKYEKFDDDDYKKNKFNNKHYYKNYYYKDKKFDNFYLEKKEKFHDKNRKNSYDYSYNSKDNNNKKYYNKHHHSRSRSSNSRSFKSFSSYSKSSSTIKNEEIENKYYDYKENENKNIYSKINNNLNTEINNNNNNSNNNNLNNNLYINNNNNLYNNIINNNNNIINNNYNNNNNNNNNLINNNNNNNLINNNNNIIDNNNNIIDNNNNNIINNNNNLNNIYPLQNFQYPTTYPFPQNFQSYLTQPNFLPTFPQISNYYPSENLNSLKEPSNTLLISNLGADINKEILDDIFREKCIELQTSVPEDIRLIESLGIAYVIFPSIPVCTFVYECLKGKILINGNYYYLNFTPNLTNNLNGNSHDSVTYVTHINKANNFQTSMETTVHEDWYCEYCDCKNFSRRTLCFKCKKPKTINCRIAPVIKQKTTVMGENGAIPPSTSIIVKGEVIKTSNEAEVKIFI